MSTQPDDTPRPARPLRGYQETGEEESRYGKPAIVRSWLILALLALVYLGWTLTVYFIEPGLR